jgi:FkbM family methyltransferase
MNKKNLKKYVAPFTLSASQTGQDLWVYGEAFNEMRNGFFLDVGAHDGLSISNTVILERRFVWNGICIEANPKTYSALVKNRKCRCVNVCLDAMEGEVDFKLNDVFGGIIRNQNEQHVSNQSESSVIRLSTRPLTAVLQECGAPREIDYLSIDIEGAEEQVFAGLDLERYMFKTITIERPTEATQKLLISAGYECVKMLPGLDYYYIHNSFKKEYIRNTYLFHSRLKFCFGI